MPKYRNLQTQEIITVANGKCWNGIPINRYTEEQRNDIGWETYVPVVEPHIPTAEEILQNLTNAVQMHLDDVAQSRNYDGILSLCSYASSAHPTFSAEGQAGVIWRDAVWDYCYQVMADVNNEQRTIPTAEELITELPTINW